MGGVQMARRRAVARTYRGKAIRPKRRRKMSLQEKQSRDGWNFIHYELPKASRGASRMLNSNNYQNPYPPQQEGGGFWTTLINLCNAIQALAWWLVSATFMLCGLFVMFAILWAITSAL